MTEMYIATGQSRALRLEPLSQSEYNSRDSSSFLLTKNFSSPQLIEDILRNIPVLSIEETTQYSQRVHTVINRVEEVFKFITDDINKAKMNIIAKIVSFPEENIAGERQRLIRQELEKCRKKVISSDFSAKALDEFASLVSSYKNLSAKGQIPQQINEDQFEWMLSEIQDNLREYSMDFQEVIGKIKSDIIQLSNRAPKNEVRELRKLEEENTQKKFDYLFQENPPPRTVKPENWVLAGNTYHEERRLAVHIPRPLTSNELGIVAKIKGREHLVLMLPIDPVTRTNEIVICDKESKKYFRRRITMPTSDADDDEDTRGKSKLVYLDNLNVILAFDGQKISLLSLTKNELMRIAVIKAPGVKFIECIPKARKIVFVYISRDVENPTTIEVMDILTRKVVQQKKLEKPTSDCLYMENRDSFVIVSKDTLLVYKVTKTGLLGQLVLQIPIETAYRTGIKASCQGNLLVIRENYLQPGRKGIELSYERFQLVLIDKRNRYQYEKCEVCTKDELWGESRDILALPGLNKLLISFNDMGQCLVELNMKKKITKLLDEEDYLERKDYRILAKSVEGDRIVVAKKDGIYELTWKTVR